MKTYKQRTCSEVDTVVCDKCGRMDDAEGMEGQEFMEHYTMCGFGSVFGDGNHLRLDLCQHCVKELLGQWIGVFDEQGSAVTRTSPRCWCHKCNPQGGFAARMILCPDCGNKRCPKASDHELACTNSNEPGQLGSVYA